MNTRNTPASSDPTSSGATPPVERLAILAGDGRLPRIIADGVVARGGLATFVSIGTPAEAGPYPAVTLPWGKIGGLIAALRGPSNAPHTAMVIAGGVKRPDLRSLKPDFGLFTSLPTVFRLLSGGDDAVLSRVVRFFEAKGLRVIGVHDVAPDLVLGDEAFGSLDPRGLAGWAEAEPALGFDVLDRLADLDIGQAVAVRGRSILAIEGVEGTDAMLLRVASLGAANQRRAGLLVKAPKTGQELRVDMPSIGPETVTKAAEAGLQGIVVEAGRTLLIDRAEAHARAKAQGVFIAGLARSRGQPRQAIPAAPDAKIAASLAALPRSARGDVSLAARAVLRLEPFGAGNLAAVIGRHVLAVSAAEGPALALARAVEKRQWGVRGGPRRGAVAFRLQDKAHDAVTFVDAAATGGFRSFVIVGGTSAPRDPAELNTFIEPLKAACQARGLLFSFVTS